MSETIAVFDMTGIDAVPEAAGAALDAHGCMILRGLFAPHTVTEAAARIADYARAPAIAGVPGYVKVDHPKRLFSPFAVGGPLVGLCLDGRVIDLVERHMGSHCVLAEANVKIDEGVNYTYFDMHADFSVGWRKNAASGFVLSAEQLALPIGIGGALYLHATHEGAFTYCLGSHRLGAPHGPDLARYPAAARDQILARRARADGHAGDLVLFDDRGFHGPDQPSRVRRSVILLDYYRVATFGHTQVSPFAVWTHDLGRLTDIQLRVLGVGADFMVPPERYMSTRFRRNPLYGLIKFAIENAYLWTHMKQKLKQTLRRGRGAH